MLRGRAAFRQADQPHFFSDQLVIEIKQLACVGKDVAYFPDDMQVLAQSQIVEAQGKP